MAKLIVTIDGPAGSGKSTVARMVAGRIKASFLDTGAMYRAVTLAAMRSNIDMTDADALCRLLDEKHFVFKACDSFMKVEIDGEDVTEDIRSKEVTANAHHIAGAEKIRQRLVAMQREFAADHEAIVTEGRDQGTVVFADAPLKVYLIADPSERARRRLAELQAKGLDENFEDILESIKRRDASDQSRAVGPLKAAADAVTVDTTNMTIEQVVDKIVSLVESNVR